MILCTLKYDSSRVKCPHKIHAQKNTRTFWRWNTFHTLIVVMVSQGYACVSTHQKVYITHLKLLSINYITMKLKKAVCPPASYRTTVAVGKKDKLGVGVQAVRGASARHWHWSWDLNDYSCHQPFDLGISLSLLTKLLGWARPSFFPNPRQRCFSIDQHGARPSALGLPSPTSTHFWSMEKKAVPAEETFSVLPFCTRHTIWQNSQKSPISLSSTINLQYLDKTFRKWVESFSEHKANALQSSKHYWKTAHTGSELLWSFKVYTK